MRLKKLESKSRDEEPFLRSGKGLELDPVRSSRCAPLSNRFAVVHIVTIILNVILAITLFSFIQGCGYPPDHGTLVLSTADAYANMVPIEALHEKQSDIRRQCSFRPLRARGAAALHLKSMTRGVSCSTMRVSVFRTTNY
jgi:hypothetical protein